MHNMFELKLVFQLYLLYSFAEFCFVELMNSHLLIRSSRNLSLGLENQFGLNCVLISDILLPQGFQYSLHIQMTRKLISLQRNVTPNRWMTCAERTKYKSYDGINSLEQISGYNTTISRNLT